MKKKVLLLSLVVFILSSCKQTTKEQQHQTLVVGAMSSLDFIPLAVAKKMNFFEANGVKVEIEKFYSANDRDAAFQSGNIDGTVIDYTGAILQKNGGIELKLTSACNATFAIISTPKESIKTINGLKGKKIAVSRNTVIDFCIDMALHSEGLTENDIEKVEINKIPLRFEMLLKGEIQATALPDPFLTMASNQGCPVIVNMNQLDYQVTGMIFSQRSINEKKEEIKAFYKSYNQGVEYIKTHTLEDIKEILIKEVGFQEESLNRIQLPEYSQAQLPREKDLLATLKWLKEKNLIEPDFSSKSIVDDQFVK